MPKIESNRKSPKKSEDVYYQAQAILARRDHAEAEVRMKLGRKGFASEQVDEVVAWLYKQKLLDDSEFAYRYAHSLIMGKPVGPQYLSAKLRQRGVGSHHISAALARVFQEYPERDAAQQAALSWERSHTQVENKREKLYRFLASRGFSLDVVNEVLADV